MRKLTFAALASTSALCVGAALAQTAAPTAAGQPAGASARSGKPADLCSEVLAFVHPPAPSAPASTPAQAQAATAQPPAHAATAVTAPSQNQGASQPSGSAGAPQQSSSISGQVTPSGPGASGPQGAAQPGGGGPPPVAGDAAKPPAPPAQQQAAAAPKPAAPAPAAPAAPPPKKPSAEQIEKVEAAARDHNLQGCRDAAQDMRKAGVVIPPPLLALAALDLKFFDPTAKPQDTDQKQQ